MMNMTISNIANEIVNRGMFDNIADAIAYVKAMRGYQRECKKIGINITEHSGKLLGFYSLSTSPLKNDRCMKRCKNPGVICFYCYSMSMQDFRNQLRIALIKNTEILTQSIIDLPPLPECCKYFRIESYGDIVNTTHALNYLKYIRENKHVFFGWWSKNNDIIEKAIDQNINAGISKPGNCNILDSSAKLNVSSDIDTLPGHVDKVFTVYDKTSSTYHNNTCINCGSRNCAGCKLCYTKNDTVYINERKK